MNMKTGFNLVHSTDAPAPSDRECEIIEHLCILLIQDAMDHGPTMLGIDTEQVIMGPRLVTCVLKHYIMNHAHAFLDDLSDVQQRIQDSMDTVDSDSDTEHGHDQCSQSHAGIDEDQYIDNTVGVFDTIERTENDWVDWNPTDSLLRTLKHSITKTHLDFHNLTRSGGGNR